MQDATATQAKTAKTTYMRQSYNKNNQEINSNAILKALTAFILKLVWEIAKLQRTDKSVRTERILTSDNLHPSCGPVLYGRAGRSRGPPM